MSWWQQLLLVLGVLVAIVLVMPWVFGLIGKYVNWVYRKFH